MSRWAPLAALLFAVQSAFAAPLPSFEDISSARAAASPIFAPPPRPILPFGAPGAAPGPKAAPPPVPRGRALPSSQPGDFQWIEDMARFISENYVDAPDAKALCYAAVKGMAQSLDPYCRFYTPEEFKAYNAQMKGVLYGVGVGLKKKEKTDPLVVRYVIPKSPAKKAGFERGDVILDVDGSSVSGQTLEEVGKKVKGPKGSSVTFGVERKDASGRPQTLKLVVVREEVAVPNSFSRKDLLPGGYGYVHFDSFRSGTTFPEVAAHIRRLKALGMRALIVDLRDNGGGAVDAAVDLVGAFVPAGETILTFRNRNGTVREWKTRVNGEFVGLPLKILLDGNSASASELFSGALQDLKRATLVGSRSFGKGVAQSVISLGDGSGLVLTANRFHLPSGRNIDKGKSGVGGLVPDVPVSMSEEQAAKVLEATLLQLHGESADPNVQDPVLDAALK